MITQFFLANTAPLVGTDEWLIARIEARYPQINEVDDWQRVIWLREFAWSHTDNAGKSVDSDAFERSFPNWYEQTAGERFAAFESDIGGVICGGAADTLCKLYELYGYTTWRIGSEIGTSGHAASLVQIVNSGQAIRVMQDAHFNVCYVDSATGKPIDHKRMIELLSDRKHDSINVLESDWTKLRWPQANFSVASFGSDSEQLLVYRSSTVMRNAYTMKTMPDGSRSFTTPRTFRKFLEFTCYDQVTGAPKYYMKDIIDNGYPPSLLYIFQKPIWLKGPSHVAYLAELQAAGN